MRLLWNQVFVKVLHEYVLAIKVKDSCFCVHAMKTCGGEEIQLHVVWTPALDGSEWLDLRLGHFVSGETAAGAYEAEDWMEPGVRLDALEKGEIFCFCRDSIHDSPAMQPVAS